MVNGAIQVSYFTFNFKLFSIQPYMFPQVLFTGVPKPRIMTSSSTTNNETNAKLPKKSNWNCQTDIYAQCWLPRWLAVFTNNIIRQFKQICHQDVCNCGCKNKCDSYLYVLKHAYNNEIEIKIPVKHSIITSNNAQRFINGRHKLQTSLLLFEHTLLNGLKTILMWTQYITCCRLYMYTCINKTNLFVCKLIFGNILF